MSTDAGGLELDCTVRRGAFDLTLDLTAVAGQVLGVLGPNGAGKTTLLRALAGLTPIDRGEIRLAGVTLDRPSEGVFVVPEERRIGLVFQNYRLFPHLSVRDNVAFGPRSRGAGRAGSRELAAPWLDRLDLGGLAERKPAELSGGQAQRVALARALAADPALLLLDEPLAALDAQTRLDLRGQLRDYVSGFTGPVLLVTHDPLEAMVLADRLLVIEDGRVVQDGSPAEVAGRPATQYVARLMGLNLYRGSLGAGGVVELDGGGRLVSNDPQAGGQGRVLVGLRPSNITLHVAAPEPTRGCNVWPGRVSGLELLADRVRVHVEGRPSALVDVSPAAVAELAVRPGQAVWVSVTTAETDAYPEPATGIKPAGAPSWPYRG